MSLPVVDFSLFASDSEKQRSLSAENLVENLKQYGFVRLSNHGLSSDTVNNLFAFSRRFFKIPLNVKKQIAYKGGSTPSRGYVGLGHEKTSKVSKIPTGVENAKDLRESFDVGSTSDIEFPNTWPQEADLPGFRQCLESYYAACQKISFEIMRALELGLGIPSGSFTERSTPGSSELRLNNYPEVDSKELTTGSAHRIWPHTDTGLVSLLWQDQVGGLEIEDRKNPGAFLPASSDDPTDLILNVADTLERWTNGVLKAGVHRVNTPDRMQVSGNGKVAARSSVVFFARANGDASAGPLASFITQNRPARYAEITVREYLQRVNSTLYTY